MNINMKKLLVYLLFFALLYFVLSPIENAEARSGCCSWHGGVCGCKCCDGTPLSAKCAPYYPLCTATPAPTSTSPTPTPAPAVIATPIRTVATPQQTPPSPSILSIPSSYSIKVGIVQFGNMHND